MVKCFLVHCWVLEFYSFIFYFSKDLNGHDETEVEIMFKSHSFYFYDTSSKEQTLLICKMGIQLWRSSPCGHLWWVNRSGKHVNCPMLHPWNTIKGLDILGIWVSSVWGLYQFRLRSRTGTCLHSLRTLVSSVEQPFWDWVALQILDAPPQLPRTRDKKENQKHRLVLNQKLFYF